MATHALSRQARDIRFGVGLVLPALAVVVLLLAYPMGYALYMSGYDWNDKLGAVHPFVGLGNYAQLITDPAIRRAMARTAVFSVVTVFGGVGAAVAIAVLLNRPFRGRAAVRVLLLVPWAIPPVVNGIMWKLIFDGSVGVANTILLRTGLADHNVQFLADPNLTMGVLIFAELWKLLPFLCLLMLAALQGVPSSIERAAMIDGAGGWRRFWRIILPNIRPAVLFALVVQSMWSLKVFDTIYVLTGGSGGPAEGTTTINFLAYLTSFSNLDRGYGAAIAVGIMILVLVVTLFWVLLLGERRDRDGVTR